MTTTTQDNADEAEVLAAITRSIAYSEIVEITDDRRNHTHTVEWIKTFAQEVGDHLLETGDRDVWGDFHGDSFRILLAQ